MVLSDYGRGHRGGVSKGGGFQSAHADRAKKIGLRGKSGQNRNDDGIQSQPLANADLFDTPCKKNDN